MYSKISLHRPTMGPILDGQFREVVGLGSKNTNISLDPHKTIDIGEWSICGGSQSVREILLYMGNSLKLGTEVSHGNQK